AGGVVGEVVAGRAGAAGRLEPVQGPGQRRLARQGLRPPQAAGGEGQAGPARQRLDLLLGDALAHGTSLPVPTSHLRVEPGAAAVTVLPSAEMVSLLIPAPALRWRSTLPVRASRTHSCPSPSAEASTLPSGE